MAGRCKACNVILTEDEMTNKWPGTTEYTDLCFSCLSTCEDTGDDSFWSDTLISLDALPEDMV